MSVSLEDLMRFERGDTSAFESARIERALVDDPEAQEWLAWLRGLRRAMHSEAPHSESQVDAVDADEIAALALGELSADEAKSVRDRLDRTHDGYALLESALEEIEFLAGDNADVEKTHPAPRSWGLLAAAVVLVGLGLLIFRSMGDDRAPAPEAIDLTALAERVAMPVPTLRNPDVTRGLVAYGDGDYEVAAKQLARAVADDPSDGLGWLYLGSARLLLQDDEGAASALRIARERAAPSLAIEATWQLAQAHLALEQRGDALDVLGALAGTRREADARRLLEALRADDRSGGR